jgi:CxxC motif-containing protein (DUF1111 family)
LFFLHDGRTTDLMEAIQAHLTTGPGCPSGSRNPTAVPQPGTQACGSEASSVIQNFNGLSPAQQQNLLNFLRSL